MTSTDLLWIVPVFAFMLGGPTLWGILSRRKGRWWILLGCVVSINVGGSLGDHITGTGFQGLSGLQATLFIASIPGVLVYLACCVGGYVLLFRRGPWRRPREPKPSVTEW